MHSPNLTIIMYHYVRDLKNSRFPRIHGLDLNLFKEQINYLKKNYNFVTIESVIAAFNQQDKLPPKSVLLTFDDAYIDHFTNVFPILQKNKIQGAFYPPVKAITEHIVLDVNKIHFILGKISNEQFSQLIERIKYYLNKYKDEYNLKPFEYYYNKLAIANRFDSEDIIFVKRLLQVELDENLRHIITNLLFIEFINIDERTFSQELYMSIDQLSCMISCGMHVGSHGYDHYWLSSLCKEKQEYEIQKSIEFLKAVGANVDNWTICYPYGDYNDITIQLLKENNCKLGLTTRVDLASTNNTDTNDIFKLPRLDTNDIPKQSNALPNNWFLKSI